MDDGLKDLMWEGIAYGIVAAGTLIALGVSYALVPAFRHRWLPLDRLRPVTWSGRDVFLSFCLFIGFREVVVAMLWALGFFATTIGPLPEDNASEAVVRAYYLRAHFVSSPLSLALILGFIVTMMFARSGARPHHYGLSWARWPVNAAVGAAMFVMMRPIIMAIFAVASQVLTPEADPFLELAKEGFTEWEWFLFAFQITVASPILEEILCRGILQGWLRRATLGGHLTILFSSVLLTAVVNQTALTQLNFGSVIFISSLAIVYGFLLYRLKHQFMLSDVETQDWQTHAHDPYLGSQVAASEEEARALRERARARDEARAEDWADANARLAIYGSAMFFAALHSNWPGPIALFPMGLALGWLARRTQSLVGPIVFHALFNLTTLIALYGLVMTGRAN